MVAVFPRAGVEEQQRWSGEVLELALRDRDALRTCREQYPRDVEGLLPRIVSVEGTVGADGRIVSADLLPAGVLSAGLRTCVLGVLASWRLTVPTSRRPTRVVYDAAAVRGVVMLFRLSGMGRG